MFERNHLLDLINPIAPQDVHLYEDLLQINIYVYSFSDYEGNGRHQLFTSKNNTKEKQSCCTGMSIMLPSTTLHVLYMIYQSIKNVKIYADNALKAFTPKSPLQNMSVFAPARTLCRCCICFWL